MKDQFWDDLYPEIPYTAAAEETRGPDPVVGAASNIEVIVSFRNCVMFTAKNILPKFDSKYLHL